jgi:hypothetical protein
MPPLAAGKDATGWMLFIRSSLVLESFGVVRLRGTEKGKKYATSQQPCGSAGPRLRQGSGRWQSNAWRQERQPRNNSPLYDRVEGVGFSTSKAGRKKCLG